MCLSRTNCVLLYLTPMAIINLTVPSLTIILKPKNTNDDRVPTV